MGDRQKGVREAPGPCHAGFLLTVVIPYADEHPEEACRTAAEGGRVLADPGARPPELEVIHLRAPCWHCSGVGMHRGDHIRRIFLEVVRLDVRLRARGKTRVEKALDYGVRHGPDHVEERRA